MGKKSKKTRWRTLTLNGHQSDSEESSSKSGLQTSKNYQHKYSKFPYSSQSTPIRKFQHDSSKSTRSNSTTSEHKTTFNEDEYTRITTPRQDVLFKKGYLNKPKSYQTQTSTGTSSTANSTSTCTPDHQSADGTEGTDLEYESQFVFPNGFIDQNGIYYINSFEPFPFVVYNAPICYSEYPNSRPKRYSTDSLTESMSPHNEEAQDLSQNGVGERINNTPVLGQTYMQPASYYYNGVCTAANGQYITEEPRRLKKRRRRKVSRSISNQEEETSEGSDYDSSDEVFSQSEVTEKPCPKSPPASSINHSPSHQIVESTESRTHPETPEKMEETIENDKLNGVQESQEPEQSEALPPEEPTERLEKHDPIDEDQSTISNVSEAQTLLLQSLLKNSAPATDITTTTNTIEPAENTSHEPTETDQAKYSLKPDAEEFIPRTFRAPEALPFDPNLQFLPANFIPIPFVNHLGELQRPPFLPPGIPLNFVPSQDPKLIPNFVNIVPNGFVPKTYEDFPEEAQNQDDNKSVESEEKQEEKPEEKSEVLLQTEAVEAEVVQVKKTQAKEIDIAKIVSKLEEAAKQQRFYEKRQNYSRPPSRYSSQRPYPTQRARYNRQYSDRYQRSCPNSSERNYRKPEGYQKERSKSASESKKDEAVVEVHTEQQEPQNERTQPEKNDSRAQKRQEHSKANIQERSENVQEHRANIQEYRANIQEHRANVQERPKIFQRKYQTDHHPVNNVNSRIGESCSIAKDLKLESTANYSETLRKSVDTVQNNVTTNNNKCVRYEKHNSEKVEKKPELKPSPTLTPKPQKAQNQWISVSSRKKRKNKAVNEEQMETEEPEEELPQDDLFESFDVNQLVDVVPPSQLVSEEPKEQPQADQEVSHPEDNTTSECPVEVPKEEESAKVVEVTEPKVEETPALSDDNIVKPAKKKQLNQKKKSKKGTQKPLMKRVIITDVNLELNKPLPKEDTETLPKTVQMQADTVEIQTQEDAIEIKINDKLEVKTNASETKPNDAPEAETSETIQIKTNETLETKTNEALETKTNDALEEKADEDLSVQAEHSECADPQDFSLNPDQNLPVVTIDDQAEAQTASLGEAEDLKTVVKPLNDNLSVTQTSESDTITETPEKKSKKKKKKATKPVLVKIQSISSSNTTLSNLDDSYDFLLENSLLEDFDQKTNVEISEELDRMIQKGMYSSLEEKIKSLQINATDDGFFKTINYSMLPNHAVQDKPSSIKAANFGKMLRNTTQLLKTPSTSDETDQNLINIDFSKIKLPDLEPQPSTSKSGIFLENPLVNELIKNSTNSKVDPSPPSVQDATKTKSNGKLKNKSKKNGHKTEPNNTKGEHHNGTIEQESKNLSASKTFSSHDVEPTDQDHLRISPPKQDSLYPITQAVKEWMTKTRENTPDVEILKSPNTIYKELYGSETETESESKSESTDSKNGIGDPRPAKSVSRETSPLSNQTKDKPRGARVAELMTNDDEITIWSVSPQNSVDEDLLDCWENELTNGKTEEDTEGRLPNGLKVPKNTPILIPNGDIKEVKGSVQNGEAHLNGHIEEGEEAIEVYESKYGKNEDFLKLKAEIEEQQKNLNFPRHGNLPYRAICCSIM